MEWGRVMLAHGLLWFTMHIDRKLGKLRSYGTVPVNT
jgi:hypothetical protein